MFVCIKSIDDAKNFCRILSAFTLHFDLTAGRNVVDAKSLVGVINLVGLKSKLICVSPATPEELEEVKKALEDYLV